MAPKRKYDALTAPKTNMMFDVTCPIGLELIENEVTLPCGHYMCCLCWEKSGKSRCPICRFTVESNWMPRANRELRVKLRQVTRQARCGKYFKLAELQSHRTYCTECIVGKLGDVIKEKNALERHILALERKIADANETIQALRSVHINYVMRRV